VSKPKLDDHDAQLLKELTKLLVFKQRIMQAYYNHPNQMSAAAADHDFVLEIAKVVAAYEAPVPINAAEVLTDAVTQDITL